jgi:hypothetical protein
MINVMKPFREMDDGELQDCIGETRRTIERMREDLRTQNELLLAALVEQRNRSKYDHA